MEGWHKIFRVPYEGIRRDLSQLQKTFLTTSPLDTVVQEAQSPQALKHISRKASAKFWEHQQSLEEVELESTSTQGQLQQHPGQTSQTVMQPPPSAHAADDLAWLNVNPASTATNTRYAANFSVLEVDKKTP